MFIGINRVLSQIVLIKRSEFAIKRFKLKIQPSDRTFYEDQNAELFKSF